MVDMLQYRLAAAGKSRTIRNGHREQDLLSDRYVCLDGRQYTVRQGQTVHTYAGA